MGKMKEMKGRQRKRVPNTGSEVDDTIEGEDSYVKKWYEGISEDPEDFKFLAGDEINRLRNEASTVLENDVLHYRNKCSKGPARSNNEWLQTMMTKGTSQDRIAASVVLVQNSPIHGLNIIKHLVNLVKTSKKECTKVMEVLTDLFISDLLMPDKKLRVFEKRPLSLLETLSAGKLVNRKSNLMLWFFEDQLKNEYCNFIHAIRKVGQDTVDSNREKAIIAMHKLLVSNPEQEVLLLASIVNKFGDPSPKVASKASFFLSKVLTEHPNMKTVVMEEIEKLLFRPNISTRAQYYGICFLSQYLLKKSDEELAGRLIQLYFSFFKGAVKQGDVDSRMMSALLTGVNRAFPFANKSTLQIKEHVETIYKIVHIAHFNVSLQALCLLFQVSDYDTVISDRFYSVLYRKILDPGLNGSSHHAMFVSLVFRAMSKDLQYSRVKVYIKRLLQLCHYVSVPLACGILVMISHILKKNKNLQSLTVLATEFKDEDDGSDGEHYQDVKLEEEEMEDSKPSEMRDSESASMEKKTEVPTWFHAANLKEVSGKIEMKLPHAYSRNPLFAGGDVCAYTELVSLSTHFHPTVSLFASRLLEGGNIEYTGDPLRDFTLARFLERWVFKNPKKVDDEKSVSKLSRKWTYVPSGVKALPVNSEGYLNSAESDIPAEELFMYRFLKKRQEEGKGPREQKDDDSDVSSVASEEFEGIMDQLMGGKEEIDFSEGINKLPEETSKNKKKKGPSELDSDSSEASEDEELEDDISNSDMSESIADDDESEDADENAEGSAEEDEMDYSDIKEEFSDLDEMDDDDEAITFDDDGEDDFSFTMNDVEDDYQSRKKSKNPNFKDAKHKKDISNVFAPAEEFAEMLEDTGDQIAKYGNLAHLSNKDNAGMKQLKWEMARDQWIKKGPNKRKRKNIHVKKQKRFKR